MFYDESVTLPLAQLNCHFDITHRNRDFNSL